MHISSRLSARAAFTLVELLTVIAIILILMGLLMGATSGVKLSAQKVQAKNDLLNIVTAVKNYNLDYGKYPTIEQTGGTTATAGDTVVGDEATGISKDLKNSELFNTLRALALGKNTDNKYNPKRTVFMEGKAVSNPAQPKAGFLDKVGTAGGSTSEKQGCFFDPWGKQYNVVLDTDYDNVIKVDEQYTDFKHPEDSPKTGVGAFSLGKDNQLGTKDDKQYKKGTEASDDIISWQ